MSSIHGGGVHGSQYNLQTLSIWSRFMFTHHLLAPLLLMCCLDANIKTVLLFLCLGHPVATGPRMAVEWHQPTPHTPHVNVII